jgi:hypothetical protein
VLGAWCGCHRSVQIDAVIPAVESQRGDHVPQRCGARRRGSDDQKWGLDRGNRIPHYRPLLPSASLRSVIVKQAALFRLNFLGPRSSVYGQPLGLNLEAGRRAISLADGASASNPASTL